MHLRPPGRHIGIDSWPLILSFELKFFVSTCLHSYNDFNSVSVWLSVPREKKSPWLCQYQFYISNWYINGKVFTSSYSMETQKFDFFSKKFEVEFWLVPRAKITLALLIININPTLVIYTSKERSSSATTWKSKNLNFFQILVACYW